MIRILRLLTSVSPKAALFSLQNVWRIFHPHSPAEPTASQWPGGAAEPFRVTSSRDQMSISGWFLPGTGPDAVVVSHGLGETALGVQAQAELLRSAGYHVAVYDLRGHGQSSRHRAVTQLSERYVSDLTAVVDHVRADARVTGNIGLLAMSFSTWTALRSCVTGETGPIAALVCDSGPERTTGRALGNIVGAKSMLESEAISAQRKNIAGLSSELAERMIGERNWPPPALAVPTLLVAGKRDRVIDAQEVQSLAGLYADADVYVHRRASHVKLCKVDPEAYTTTVLGHFNAHLSSNVNTGQEAKP